MKNLRALSPSKTPCCNPKT